MRRMRNRTKDKIVVSLILMLIAIMMIVGIFCISRLFATEIYETDIYAYTTVEHAKYYEIKKFDKVAGQYLESSFVGKEFGEE